MKKTFKKVIKTDNHIRWERLHKDNEIQYAEVKYSQLGNVKCWQLEHLGWGYQLLHYDTKEEAIKRAKECMRKANGRKRKNNRTKKQL